MKKNTNHFFKKVFRIMSIVVTVVAFIQLLYWFYVVALPEIWSWFIKFDLHSNFFI